MKILPLFKTMCARDCPDACFLDVEVRDGVVTSVRGSMDNPVTAGLTCPRALGDSIRVYSMNRVLKPYVRSAEPGRFRLSTWDEALGLASDRLKATLETHGPGAVLLLEYAGNTGLITSGFSKRLWHAIGATMTDHALCSASGHAAIGHHYGLTYGVDPEELLTRKVIVFWGFNARHSSPHIWAIALRAKSENKAVIAVVDPRESESTSMADLWLYPRPSSDVALAYGLARYLIKGGHVDEDFIEGYTHGYDLYKAEALRWTPERVEKVTGVSWEGVEALGEALVEYGSPVFMIGIGLNKGLAGAESVRAVSLLPALLGQHRGFYYSNSSRYNLLDGIDGSTLTDKPHDVVSQITLGKRLAAGEYKYVYVQTMNPALTLPDSQSVSEGLKRDDVFLVVHDTHLTETCDLADVVLPAPTYLEKDDLVLCDSHPYTRKAVKAIEPEGESRGEPWVMKELARRIGVEEPWVYADPWDAAAETLRDTFVDGGFDDYMRGATLRLHHKPLDEYQTPTGRIELHSTTTKNGISPIPEQIEFSVASDEFIMLNSSVPKYLHTQFRDVYGEIPAKVWVNPSDADANNLGDGDAFTLVNELGRLNVEAVVTDKVPRGVIWSPRELLDGEGNAQNSLTPGVPQRIGGGPIFNSTKVRIL